MSSMNPTAREQEQLAKWANMSNVEVARRLQEKATAIANTNAKAEQAKAKLEQLKAKHPRAAAMGTASLGKVIAFLLIAGVVVGFLNSGSAPAPTTYMPKAAPTYSLDEDKITSFAAMIGKGMGCGLNTSALGNKAAEYITANTAHGSEARKAALAKVTLGAQLVAEVQRNGGYPESCSSIASAYSKLGL